MKFKSLKKLIIFILTICLIVGALIWINYKVSKPEPEIKKPIENVLLIERIKTEQDKDYMRTNYLTLSSDKEKFLFLDYFSQVYEYDLSSGSKKLISEKDTYLPGSSIKSIWSPQRNEILQHTIFVRGDEVALQYSFNPQNIKLGLGSPERNYSLVMWKYNILEDKLDYLGLAGNIRDMDWSKDEDKIAYIYEEGGDNARPIHWYDPAFFADERDKQKAEEIAKTVTYVLYQSKPDFTEKQKIMELPEKGIIEWSPTDYKIAYWGKFGLDLINSIVKDKQTIENDFSVLSIKWSEQGTKLLYNYQLKNAVKGKELGLAVYNLKTKKTERIDEELNIYIRSCAWKNESEVYCFGPYHFSREYTSFEYNRGRAPGTILYRINIDTGDIQEIADTKSAEGEQIIGSAVNIYNAFFDKDKEYLYIGETGGLHKIKLKEGSF